MSTSSLYVYLQRPDTGEWITLGRYSLDRATCRGLFIYAPSYIEAGHPWCVDPINLAPMDDRRYIATRYSGLTDVLRDTSPDSWGKILLQREHGLPATAHEMDYLRLAGNGDRWGALAVGVGKRPDVSAARRPRMGVLADLLEELDLIQRQRPPKHAALRRRVLQTPSLGGARPKVTVQEGETIWLVKPTVPTDSHDVARAEYVTMQWARMAGLNAAPTRLYSDPARTAVMVERFDRTGDRRHMVISGATLLQTEYPAASHATPTNQALWSYPLLSQSLRIIGAPLSDQKELFGRMIFNALVGNDDDHPRNHAVVWNAEQRCWRLSPAFDVVPNIDAPPRTLCMQLSLGRYDISRAAALADWRHFGFAAQSEAEEVVDSLVEQALGTFKDASELLTQDQGNAMKKQLAAARNALSA